MAQAPPSGTGQVDKSYFKNSVAKDGKAKALAKGIMAKTKETVATGVNEVKLIQQYEGEPRSRRPPPQRGGT
jgi:hypothetical protein